MRIREYTSADLGELRRMHAAQGFGYPLPDLGSPMFISKLVLEEDRESVGVSGESGEDGEEEPEGGGDCIQKDAMEGREAAEVNSLREISSRARDSRSAPPRVTMAILQRLTAETYLLHDPAAGTPRLRWQHFLALHDAARRHSAALGLDDVQAFLPPRIARAFGRRLERLGWVRDPWACFTLRI